MKPPLLKFDTREKNMFPVRERQVGGTKILAAAVKAMVSASFPANGLHCDE
jgi:hypothetical protein